MSFARWTTSHGCWGFQNQSRVCTQSYIGISCSQRNAGNFCREDRRAELQKKIEAKQAALKEKKETTKSLIEKTEKNHEEIKVAEKVLCLQCIQCFLSYLFI